MQTDTLLYEYSKKDLRKPTWRVSISFDKQYNASTTFFKVGDSGSQIGGADFIPGTSSVVQEWDKYLYTDYSDRVISIDNIEFEEDKIYSVVSAQADITFNNYDGYFNPDGTSAIASYILPYRPIRIWLGFEDRLVAKFVGLTEGMPVIDEDKKTATFHAIDFLSYIYNKDMALMDLQVNKRTDQILDEALQTAGLLSTQYDLDTGNNTINVYAPESGDKFIDIVRPLMEAEQGRLYMDEEGRIKFKNRQNTGSDTDVKHAFEVHRDIIDVVKRTEDDIINSVTIKSDIRTLQASQSVFTLSTPKPIARSEVLEYFVELADPCSSIDSPVLDATSGSTYSVNTNSDGTGAASTNVTVTSTYLYGRTYKIVFTNASSTDSYFITNLELYGTPYKVTDNIVVTETDSTSISKYGERPYVAENNNFTDETTASAKALIMIDDYNEYGAAHELTVKGTPQFQLGDVVTAEIYGRMNSGRITRIRMSVSRDDGFKQVLTLKEYTRRSYFRVGDGGSQIGGSDYISY